jgi:hypothetical protein
MYVRIDEEKEPRGLPAAELGAGEILLFKDGVSVRYGWKADVRGRQYRSVSLASIACNSSGVTVTPRPSGV